MIGMKKYVRISRFAHFKRLRDRPTDRPTDMTSYRSARTHLKRGSARANEGRQNQEIVVRNKNAKKMEETDYCVCRIIIFTIQICNEKSRIYVNS